MMAPGLANAVLAQHFVLGVLAYLFIHFGSLLKKLLFLGLTLLLRLWACQATVVRLVGWLAGWLAGWLVSW